MIAEELWEAIDAVVPAGVTHIGFVPVNQVGQVLVAEPEGHPYRVSATFSKVKRMPKERPSAALARCLQEQVGQVAASVYPVGNVWVTPNSVGCHFAGVLCEGADAVRSDSATLRWCDPREAGTRLQQSANAATRQRDLGLLATVESLCVSPYRNVLLMVRELHKMGFERLRACPYIYALGTWRCAIAPAAWIHNRGEQGPGTMPFELTQSIEKRLGQGSSVHFYTSASEQRLFADPKTWFLPPRALAEQYLQRHPALAAVGYGPDPAYVAWFERTLDLLAPNGIFYAFAEYEPPTNELYTLMAPVRRAPLPPPGHLDLMQWQEFQQQHRQSEL